MRTALAALALAAMVVAGARADEVVDTTAPAPRITAPSGLTAAATISFSEPVRLVSSDNVRLRVRGSSDPLPASLACRSAVRASVSCAAGDVRSISVRPVAPFVTGQRYDLAVNPDGVLLPIVDAMGNAARQTTATFRASVDEQESSAGATYRWDHVPRARAYGGSYRRERTAGARFTYAFTGSSITWFTVRGPSQGTATVWIDGVRKATVNNYAARSSYRVPRSFAGLAAGAHRLTVVVDGRKGSRRGVGTSVAFDALAVDGSLVDAPAAVFHWDPVGNDRASRDRYVRSEVAGVSVTFVFRGRRIDWHTITGPGMGRAEVRVDGRRRMIVDNYSRRARYGVRRSVTGLADATHTLTVVVRGDKARASSGRMVAVDRFTVRAASIVAFKRLGAWVDLYDYGLDPSRTVRAMDARGVRTIYLQTARYNSDASIVHPAAVGGWLEAAHAAGLRVIGWYLPAYDQFLSRDVARTLAIASFRSDRGHRFDGLAIDIEYKGATESRREFNDGIRAHLARVRSAVGIAYPIGAITPAPLGMAISPASWEDFPWAAIGRDADVVMPMSYWSYRTDCARKPQHCPEAYTETNIRKALGYTKLPVHIIGGIGNEVSASEVGAFARGARDANAYGGSLYDYRTTRSSFWEPLSRLNGL